jgi:hypothetical protein
MKKHFFFSSLLIMVNSYVFAQTSNVGIDTANPANKLTVNGNASVGTAYTSINAPANGAIIEGNAGIGTSSPLTKLHVNGQTKINDGTVTNICPFRRKSCRAGEQ